MLEETLVLFKNIRNPKYDKSLAGYKNTGGFKSLKKVFGMKPEEVVQEVKESGVRGRGGAGFPTGLKWSFMAKGTGKPSYLVANADESEPGTCKDRELMLKDPHLFLEGLMIGSYAVGCHHAYVYVRGEFFPAIKILNAAVDELYADGLLGHDPLGSGFNLDITIHTGAGAYICGEETALLESLEGKRGMVRAKPPLPAITGLWGQPTVINNVISLASVPIILSKGASYYKDFGMGRSRGTLPFQLAGNIRQAGLVELAFGPSLNTLLQNFGGGTRTGRPMKAVQVGGPLGAYLPLDQWDTELDYEAFATIDAVLGHGGIVAFDDTVDMGQQARFSMEFCVIESCGKCTPCRIGSTRGVEVIDKTRAGDEAANNTLLLEDLCETMTHGSLCAMGGMTPIPVLSALKYFPEDFNSSTINVST